ncbi:hypothetical protein GCM10009821_10270 [Aeromicrobium halocynthiae]|uniref:Peptidase S9 prolyl oligopeptidase catalytic domain-containing protein n=1 Tax=Aeromicrobium halocynthiae TaxID=560557 RepID=A0ABN2VVU2_9ACTN
MSLPARFERPVRGGRLERVGPVEDRGAYTRREVTYRSDETTASGVLLEPVGDGPFPAVVLNHGSPRPRLRELDVVDPDRVAMFGRSMGGGVTLNALVMEPDVVDAAVVHASVSSDFVDNLRQFTEPNRPERVEAMRERWGSPEESPEFYADLSSRTYT